jgi:hypothetical protein
MTVTDVLFWDADTIVANPFADASTRKVIYIVNFIALTIYRDTLRTNSTRNSSDGRKFRPIRRCTFTRGITESHAPQVTNAGCIYTGKTNEQGVVIPGQKDDMMIAFTMNAFFSRIVKKDPSAFFNNSL